MLILEFVASHKLIVKVWTAEMQGMWTFSLKASSIRRADVRHICLANARLVFSRFPSNTQMEEYGYDSTMIADIQKAKGKCAARSWLSCVADDTAYDVAKLVCVPQYVVLFLLL